MSITALRAKSLVVVLFCLLLQVHSPLQAATEPVDTLNSLSIWKIKRSTWTSQDEFNFSRFVEKIGYAVADRTCADVRTCLQSAANPYRKSDPPNLRLYADCADFPYYLRAYFAWKNSLPMSVAAGLAARGTTNNSDLRYSSNGNKVTSRLAITQLNAAGIDAVKLLNSTIVDTVYSASLRMMGDLDSGTYSDFYPLRISRDVITPGTVIYDPNGHVAMVYRVSQDGRIYYIDAHPDNTLTSGMYTPKFIRSVPGQGAGFKKFRPLSLVGATKNTQGDWLGGQVVAAKNLQLPEYSLEQFYGNQPDSSGDWAKGKFVNRGTVYAYYDYVRLAMAVANFKISPLKDIQEIVKDICISLEDRVVAVDLARKAGVDKKPHPLRLPPNIYTSSGEWENYATPARDARLKVAFMDLISEAQKLIKRYQNGDPRIDYSGNNIVEDVLQSYTQAAQSCKVTYVNSKNQRVTLNLEDLRRRLFDLSFSPYHCVELRWGASRANELAGCQSEENKLKWYSQQRWLRYQWERTSGNNMGYSLDELTGPFPGVGISQPPNIDIYKILRN